MTTAAVVYRSSTGTTRRFAEAIAAHLGSRGVEAHAASIDDRDPASLAGVDLVLLGCWTSGLFVIGQHPDGPWVSWAGKLPDLQGARVALFTTYKLATGSMFRRMRAELARTGATIDLELKSRNGQLSADHQRQLDAWLAARPRS